MRRVTDVTPHLRKLRRRWGGFDVKHLVTASLTCLLLSASAGQVLAWGGTAHHMISRMAKEMLPDGLPTFLSTPDVPFLVGELNQAGHELRGWGDLHRAAARLAPMIGIQAEAWFNAQQALGLHTALALIFEKTCEGHIRSPTSYLVGMINRAHRGELNLVRSFQARLTSPRS
jgi:hypothetical protein